MKTIDGLIFEGELIDLKAHGSGWLYKEGSDGWELYGSFKNGLKEGWGYM